MACNNGKKGFHSPYGMITDLNITYTGCSTTCNGEEIKPGMRLREILDILIGDCAESGSATWGDIIGNIEDQTDLVQFIQDNISVTNWGSILGDITDQEDLVQFVQENGFTADKVGKNLHLGDDGKLNVGMDMSDLAPGSDIIIISQDGVYPPGADKANLILSGGAGNQSELVSAGSNLRIRTAGGGLLHDTTGGDISILSSGGDFNINTDSGEFNILSGNNSLGLLPDNVSIAKYSGGSLFIGEHVAFPGKRVARLEAVNNMQAVVSGIYIVGDPSSPSEGEIVVGTYTTTDGGHFNQPVKFRYGQDNPTVTDDNEITPKIYVDDLIAGLQNTIDALEARIEALENA